MRLTLLCLSTPLREQHFLTRPSHQVKLQTCRYLKRGPQIRMQRRRRLARNFLACMVSFEPEEDPQRLGWTHQAETMRSRLISRTTGIFSVALVTSKAWAHAFTQPYTLPVPFWMYAWGSAAALLLSFVIVGLVIKVPGVAKIQLKRRFNEPSWRVPSWITRFLKVTALACLALCILTGFFGRQRPLDNISMTLFWIVFILLIPYLCAVFGNFYAIIDPWKSIVELTEKLRNTKFTGILPAHRRPNYAVALIFYVGFIWLELFGELTPKGLALGLIAYTVCNIAGAWIYGSNAWFRYGEFFSVFFQIISQLSPVVWERIAPGPHQRSETIIRLKSLRGGESDEHDRGLGFVLFVLFMLSSTAFDGLHSTLPWMKMYWNGLYPALTSAVPGTSLEKLALGTAVFKAWQWTALVLSPFVYYLIFRIFCQLMKFAGGSNRPGLNLSIQFATTLVPIALAYHATHYYTLLLAQIGQLMRLASDPFAFGWDLFGTAKLRIAPWMVDVEFIWHSQVILILIGHIASVYLAHAQALRVFPTHRQAIYSQIPMLVLMVLFTAMGLWIMSLPLAPGV